MPFHRAHMEGIFIRGKRMEGGHTSLWGQEQQKRETGRGGETVRQAEKQRERGTGEGGSGQGPFKRECNECAQEMLLVVSAEDVSCQNPKGRPVQLPEN